MSHQVEMLPSFLMFPDYDICNTCVYQWNIYVNIYHQHNAEAPVAGKAPFFWFSGAVPEFSAEQSDTNMIKDVNEPLYIYHSYNQLCIYIIIAHNIP